MVDRITWKSFIDSPDRGYWDGTMIADLLEPIDYADILVTPGHWRDGSVVDHKGLVFITSDEEGECPFWELPNPVWKMTPNPHLAYQPDHAIPLGYTPHTRPTLREADYNDMRKYRWSFSGQVNNGRRHSALEQLRKRGDGKLYETAQFAAGINPADYIRLLAQSDWVPCPAGNVRPETFRMWEALEAGAVPILDATSPHGDSDYWPRVIGEHPFPVLADWSQIHGYLESPAPRTEAATWYSWFRYRWTRDVWEAWSNYDSEPWLEPVRRITTIITASPIPSHPDISVLAETVESVRARLPGRIIVAFDGPRSADSDYEEHIRRVCHHANLFWPEVSVWYTGNWKHQAGTLIDLLPEVYPDHGAVLMMEHDTPLTGDIPFHRLTELLYLKHFDLIRFHHESSIPPEHKHLMDDVYTDAHVSVQRTRQYSQRPHIALLGWYKQFLSDLGSGARTYVEDWAYNERTEQRLGIYLPDGDIKRSYHLDGRAGEPKGEFWF